MENTANTIQNVVTDPLLRAAPPLTVVGISMETCLSNTVYAITAVYVLLQIIVILPKVRKVLRRKQKNKHKYKQSINK